MSYISKNRFQANCSCLEARSHIFEFIKLVLNSKYIAYFNMDTPIKVDV